MADSKFKPLIRTNDKILDAIAVAMNPQTRLLTLEGTIRSAKTVTAIIAFHYRVQQSGAKFHLIAGRNLDTIRRNIIKAELGLMTLFPDKYVEKADRYGATFIQAKCPNGIKEIIICGYSDKTRWENITGGSIENIMLDEANLADEQFLNECFARQVAALNPFTVFTLNGDDPQHLVYQNFVNYSVIIGDCPASTRADMDKQTEKKRGFRYMFFSFRDNPIMTQAKCRDAEAIYPKDSYYYKTRVLGERGTWGTMIYTDYMTTDLLIDAYAKDAKGKPKYEITSYAIGADTAENRAFNVFALLGYDSTMSYCYVLDLLVFQSTSPNGTKNGYKFKTEMLRSFLKRHEDKAIKFIAVDSAEGNYINDLKGENLGAPVIGSYKATIKERIDMNIILFSGKRCLFNARTALLAYQAFLAAKWTPGKENVEREDLGAMINDIMDAVEYGQTKYMTALTYGKGRDRK